MLAFESLSGLEDLYRIQKLSALLSHGLKARTVAFCFRLQIRSNLDARSSFGKWPSDLWLEATSVEDITDLFCTSIFA